MKKVAIGILSLVAVSLLGSLAVAIGSLNAHVQQTVTTAELALSEVVDTQTFPSGQYAVEVILVTINPEGQGVMSMNKIISFPGETTIMCLNKPGQLSGLCFVMTENGAVYTSQRRLVKVQT